MDATLKLFTDDVKFKYPYPHRGYGNQCLAIRKGFFLNSFRAWHVTWIAKRTPLQIIAVKSIWIDSMRMQSICMKRRLKTL